ncbi:hypothetical protein L226DRAFT_92588 [Lentinus tigrinus ALCF2SS1-7]|uniref:Uncharacterized protein n=1 Tax=Lentinus tigrinus ALCF2SS1-6 TaxID=1328759 RepID=A0A5C2RYH9_9APHY|nr:hypothetical protein L227DRAFT_287292 [Lentinus tigrinus ALCF2SS1-6]RPD74002.1 hypothetical protein L226DRAFT_92588 [Lentinus tigrinus ALCF2SS1-7]
MNPYSEERINIRKNILVSRGLSSLESQDIPDTQVPPLRSLDRRTRGSRALDSTRRDTR